MSYKLRIIGFLCASSVVLGFATDYLLVGGIRFENGLDSDNDSSGSQMVASLSHNLGQGITIATLGGYRTVTANFVWISMYGDWQYRKREEVLQKMQLAVSLNPDSLFFWIDGSRIIANDMPVWEVGDERMSSLFETADGIAVRKKYGKRALSFLDQAPDRVQNQVPFLVERGVIHWQRLDDLDRAIAFFAEAVERENVPYYVCRVYAVLLERNGQGQAALEFLKRHYESLPDDEPAAMKQSVARRIRDLESLLQRQD